jgi:hypothetical protein
MESEEVVGMEEFRSSRFRDGTPRVDKRDDDINEGGKERGGKAGGLEGSGFG